MKTNKRGISLIILVITIIIMIVLVAAVVIALDNSGIINKANEAADNMEIITEKATLQIAIALAQSKVAVEGLTLEALRAELDAVDAEENEIDVMEYNNEIVIMYAKTNRVYVVDKSGNIEGPNAPFQDEHAGDLTKGGANDGTKEKPYVINCIEDLVEFSKNYTKYQSKYVVLARTLDFNTILSYNNHVTTIYGDLNGDGTIQGIKTELTKQGENCAGFTPIASFKGTFDGKNNKICNLYVNRGSNNAGLFLECSGTIKNLGLENITLIGGNYIGGITAALGTNGRINNCFVVGTSTIEDTSTGGQVGLIIGNSRLNNIIVEDCYSTGKLNLKKTGRIFWRNHWF